MSTMKAWRYGSTVGSLEKNLELLDIPKWDTNKLPDEHILVEVSHVGLNPADYKLPEIPIAGRAVYGLPATPSMDFSGKVAATHPSVTRFKTGQLVFGRLPRESTSAANRCGALAQFLIIPESKGLVALPEGLDLAQGAAIGTAAATAYQAINPYVKADQSILLHGASGGVGTYCIQFAKSLGMKVTAVCSTGKIGLCKELGADDIIDYKTTNLLDELKSKGQIFDHVVDNVGKDLSLAKAADTYCKPEAHIIQPGGGGASFLVATPYSMLPSFLGGCSRSFKVLMLSGDSKTLEAVGNLTAEGKLRPIIEKTFPFEETPKAFELLRTGSATGKILVKVADVSGQ